MTTYRVNLLESSYHITVCNDSIIQAPTIFKRFIGPYWQEFNDFIRDCGFTIDLIETDSKSDWLEFDGVTYELRWSDDRKTLKRMSKHINGRIIDIGYNSLPLVLRMAL